MRIPHWKPTISGKLIDLVIGYNLKQRWIEVQPHFFCQRLHAFLNLPQIVWKFWIQRVSSHTGIVSWIRARRLGFIRSAKDVQGATTEVGVSKKVTPAQDDSLFFDSFTMIKVAKKDSKILNGIAKYNILKGNTPMFPSTNHINTKPTNQDRNVV